MNARGRGKAILLGEHAVVYGYPALAVALDRGVLASRTDGPPRVRVPQFGLDFSPGDVSETSSLRPTLDAIAARARPITDTLTLHFELPTSRGLGTSAALGVAVARALLGTSADVPEASVEYAAQAAEESFHGRPSGLDLTTSLRGGALCFTKGTPPRVEPVDVRERFSLVIADTGRRPPTSELVAGIKALRDQDACRVDDTFERIGVLVERAAQALRAGDLAWLGQLMDENHALLQTLRLSTPALDQGCEAARRAGALGAKLTGAGGGGALLALCRRGSEDPVRRALSAAGLAQVEADLAW